MYISIRDETVYGANYTTLAEGLQDLEIEGVELWVRRDYTIPSLKQPSSVRLSINSQSDIARLKAEASQEGIKIAALCMGTNFNSELRDQEVNWVKSTIEASDALQIPVVRIDAIMHNEDSLPLDERMNIVADGICRCLEATSSSSVDLGIENHGFQGNDPLFLHGILNKVRSERLGLTLDSGNFYWRGWPLHKVYDIFAEFAQFVKHTHLKNIRYPDDIRETQREMGYEYGKYVCPIHEGDIDHSRYISILKNADYTRDLCLEDESLGKYSTEVRQHNLRESAKTFRGFLR